MSTALYRRYRPETFQDVIGQEHVTEPLMTALQNNRVNHAYLFSGPRGCGKTTSARILARCLNCAEGPTPTPCGHCESCRDLARDGAGSLDVIEMDAASHGGVDHARDLRERATFAPVRDRYKIFIIDEAHMVTREGFNALLKIVEEPPEHIKFVFATTEPNKVLGTIRSRTHHYPFRLVAPEVLRAYLQRLCEDEGVAVEQGVLPLVVRAGGGSVRDSLSVLDQLMGGSGPEGITYDLAVALLGFTHAELLDGVVDAFAAGDSPAVFQAVDRVIQTGQDPRRFVEDLLERFRDLIIVKAVPDSAAQILHGMPEDQIDRMKGQAHQMGAAELSRAADITNQALTEMIGATSPQLHLELLCARILLPTADDSSRGVNARVDRLERRINLGTVGAVQAPLQADPASVMTPETPAEHAAAEGLAETGMQAGGGREAALAMARRTRQDSENRPESRPEGSGSTEDGAAHDDTRGRRSSAPADSSRGTGGQNHAAPEDAAAPGRETAGPGTPETRSGHQPPSQGETAAPPRGPNRPDPAQDAEDAHGRGPERPQKQGNGPRDDEASGYHPQPTAAPDAGQVNLVARSWTDVVAAVGHHSKVAQATFRECRPARFENGVLYVQSAGPGIQSRVERYAGACAAALQETLGIDCRVAVDGSGPQDAPEGPGGSGGPGGSRGPSGPQGGPSGSAQGSVQRTRDGARNGSSGDRWGGQSSGRPTPDDASGARSAEAPRGARDQNDPDWPDDRQWQEAARRAQDQEARSAGASDSSDPSGRRSVPSENTADAEPPRPAASGPAELPEGPRSGEDAWKQHGEPLGSEDPEWSEDAEGETFTGWAVARIPDGPEDDAETPENPPQDDARAAGRTADDGTETPQTDEGPNPSGPEAGSEPPTDTARLRVLSGQGGRAAQSDPADPRAAASLTVVPPLGEEDDREQIPDPAVDASETLGEDSVDAAASSTGPSESGPRPPAHDWAVAARNAGAPGAPVDGRDCGWGFSGPTQGADHRDHPSRWGQRAPHLASVAPEPQEHAEPEQPTDRAPGRQDATSDDAERHLHAVPARQEPAEHGPDALPPEDRMPSAGSPAEGRPASGGAEEHRPFHERYADQIAAGAAHGVAPGRGSSARRGPVDPNAPEPPDDDWDAFVPAPEDEDLEDSAVYGQAAVETILGGRVLEERPHHQQ